MRRKTIFIILAVALIASITTAATPQYKDWTDTQNAVHDMADQARALGLPEDNPIIAECQRIWWTEEDNKKAETQEEKQDGPLLVYYGNCYITGYYTGSKTASGTRPAVGRTCATAISSRGGLPFGTTVYIDGIGYRTVEDRGGGGKNWVDVFCSSKAECYSITGYRDVWIVQ